MDTTVESTFNVHINDHIIVKFLKCGHRLNYFDTDKSNKSPVNAYSFLSTVKDNKLYFCSCEIEGADIYCDLQGKIGWPFVQNYQKYYYLRIIIRFISSI